MSLFWDKDSGTLWIGSDKAVGLPAESEILGYGAGEFHEGPTAADVMSDASGRWFMYDLKDLCQPIIVEADRKLPAEIRSLPVFNKVQCLCEQNVQHPFKIPHPKS